MGNQYKNIALGAESGGANLVLVTPDDDNDLPEVLRAIAFSAEGTLKVKTLGGTIVTIPSGTLAAGMFHPIFIVRVYATGTTVTDILGVY
jgi:hypothetical protein